MGVPVGVGVAVSAYADAPVSATTPSTAEIASTPMAAAGDCCDCCDWVMGKWSAESRPNLTFAPKRTLRVDFRRVS